MSQQTRTVLFTDIVGSTSLRTSRGDDAGDHQLRVHDEVVHRAIDEHEGIVIKGTGDGTLATFDSARHAVAAAIAIQRELIRRRRDRVSEVELRVRIGINAGDVRALEGDPSGEAVNAAARIVGEAQGDEILVSRVVRELVGTAEASFEDRGESTLRGFPEPWRLYSVIWSDVADAAPLRVRLLGEISVTLNGLPLAGFESVRLQRLLARLVLAPGVAHSRTQLAFDLWPDSSEPQARTNLRKLLHELRRAIPELDRYAEVHAQAIRWRRDAPASVDVVEFSDAMARSDLGAAIDAYGGDLLPGCYDEWVLAERDRLRVAAADALGQLAAAAAERGDDALALAHGRELLRLDSLREDGYRIVMAAHARLGERVEAIRAYHRCVEILDRELGVEPDAATTALYEMVRVRADAKQVLPSRAAEFDGAASSRLVGREEEWSVALRAWHAARADRCSVLLVTGEPGIGKSRLVEELARVASAEGHSVVRARAYESAGRLPWGPVVDWLRSDEVRPRFRNVDAAQRSELGRLVPELRAAASTRTANWAEAEDARYALFEALAAALVDDERATLLALDDVQWCDPDTIDLLGFLIHRRSDAKLLVAVTARDEEIDEAHEFSRLAAGLARDGILTEVTLDALDTEATAELAARLGGVAVDADVAAQIWRETEGNPLFVIEAMRAGFPEPGRAPMLTPTVQAVISSRLQQLSPDARGLAELAATIGREFRVDVLAAATGSDEDDLVDLLDELWHRRIIREHPSGYDFTHDRLREVARDSVSPARRRRLHRAIAEALVAVHGADASSVSASLAAHYEAAGLLSEAVAAHRKAADHALHVYALDDAVASFRQALLLLERLPAGRERDLVELDLRVAVAAALVVRDGYAAADAQETYERALSLCRKLDQRIDPAVLRGLGLASLSSCRFDRARYYAQALLDQSDDPVALVEGHYLMGVSQFWRAEFPEACDHLQAAIDAYEPGLSEEHRVRYAQDPKGVCLVRLAFTMLWQGDTAGAHTVADEAHAFLASIDHTYTSVYGLGWLGMLAAEAGDRDRLAAALADAARMEQAHTLGYAGLVVELMSGWLDVLDDRAAGPLRLSAVIEELRGGESVHLTYALLLRARAYLTAGDVERGRAAAREAIEWGVAHDQRWAEAELWRVDGQLAAAGGDLVGADDAHGRARELARAQGAGLVVERLAVPSAGGLAGS